MNGKEIVKRIIHHDAPSRIGFNFKAEGMPSDIAYVQGTCVCIPEYKKYSTWGRYPELLERCGGFSGEVRLHREGNIYGRFDQKTKGECIKGVLQDGWELLESYEFPKIDEEFEASICVEDFPKDKYLIAGLPFAVFAPLRDMRHMDNALMDTILEPEYVTELLDKLCDINIEAIRRNASRGVDACMIWDDMGTQHSSFFSPKAFKELFKPFYKRLADELHRQGLDFIVHSCGKVTEFIPDLIEAGVDMLQFDQPELHGSEFLARTYGDKIAFYCPVDIQAIMPTGDREIIEKGAKNMVDAFKRCGGSLVAKDYNTWSDINVEPEWQQWARDIIIKNAEL